MFWSNERELPQELLGLLEENPPDLPDELRQEILQAQNEITAQGAVTYPTKARVEASLNRYVKPLVGERDPWGK